jgi:hypothetical protein
MEDRNPYSAPEAPLIDAGAQGQLADLGERLAAALIQDRRCGHDLIAGTRVIKVGTR